MISTIICTHNRADVLRGALNSFSRMHGLKDVAHELLVIDNKSTDNTKMVLQEFTNIKTLRYVLEERLGLSHARNRGISESSGEIIAFVDDDVYFSKDWLIELNQGIKNWPDALAFGGKAVSKWEIPKPSWFVDEGFFSMRMYIAHFEPDLPEGYINRNPYGCNMAFRRSIIENFQFDGELGRKGSALFSSEEEELFIKIKQMEGKIVYLPKAMVFHRILQDRGERQYYLRWAESQSKSIVSVWRRHRFMRRRILGIPLRLIKLFIKAMIKVIQDYHLFRDTNRFFAYRLRLMTLLRYIWQFMRNSSCQKNHI